MKDKALRRAQFPEYFPDDYLERYRLGWPTTPEEALPAYDTLLSKGSGEIGAFLLVDTRRPEDIAARNVVMGHIGMLEPVNAILATNPTVDERECVDSTEKRQQLTPGKVLMTSKGKIHALDQVVAGGLTLALKRLYLPEEKDWIGQLFTLRLEEAKPTILPATNL